MIDSPAGRVRRVLPWAGPLAIATGLGVATVVGARAWIEREQAQATERWRAQLSAMAEDRGDAIESWVRERLGDARTVAAYPTTVYLASGRRGPPYPFPPEQGAREHLAELLRSTRDFFGYEGAWLVAAGPGSLVLAATVTVPPDRALVGRVLERGDVEIDFRPRNGGAVVVVAAPVRETTRDRGRPVGVVLLAADVRGPLFALLGREPVPTRTGESLLVRREAAEVVFLSPLRHGPTALRLPWGTEELAAAAALQGREAFGTFRDYRGAVVLAAVRPIRGTAWGLVVKIDRDEALEAARVEARRTGSATAGVLLALLGIAFGLWRQHAAAARIALARSEARFGLVLEHAADAILFVRPDGRIAKANRRAEELYGCARPELECLKIHDLYPTERAGAIEARMAEVRSRSAVVFETEHRARDGTALPVEVSSRYLEEEDLFFWIVRDIRERKRAEQAVRRLSAAVEQSPVAIVITDTGGTIEYVNPAFCRQSGYSRDEALGRNPRILKSGHHPKEFYDELYATIGAGGEWRGEMLNRKKDGDLYWEYASISPIVDEGGSPRHYLAVQEDITERKKAEEALRRAQDQLLQSRKLEAVGRLAGGVAHDFNNLLGVIIGHGELAQRAAGPADPLQTRLEQILGAAQRAAELTRQLLAFSRRQVLQPRILDLNAEVADMEKMLRRLIGEDIELATRLDPALARVRADPGQIGQVLMNLAVNARDAMPQGGVLTIETANVQVDLELAKEHAPMTPGAYVRLVVSDDGAGLDASAREHLFEPFFTTKPEGSGLGLSTVYGIVKQSSGHVWAEPRPERGTTFTVLLPRWDGPPDEPLPPATPQAAGGSETILVVEDQHELRALICEVLEDAGYRVLQGSDGRSALALSDSLSEPIHLLLTDVVMPGMSGRELAEALGGRRKETRTLLMSGYPNEAIERSGGLGGFVLLVKPFSRTSLLQHVRNALQAPQG